MRCARPDISPRPLSEVKFHWASLLFSGYLVNER
jgi:hypothetical protein